MPQHPHNTVHVLATSPSSFPMPQGPNSDFVVVGVMSNLVAAVMSVRGTLRHLTIETAGTLVISQWAGFLSHLTSACFIGGEVQVGAA